MENESFPGDNKMKNDDEMKNDDKLDSKYLVFQGSDPSKREDYEKNSPGRRVRITLKGFQDYGEVINEIYKELFCLGWNPPEGQEFIVVARPPFSKDDLSRAVDGEMPYSAILQTYKKYPWENCNGKKLPTYEVENCSKDKLRQTVKKMLSEQTPELDSYLEDNLIDAKLVYGLELKVDKDTVNKIHQNVRDKFLDERVDKILKGKNKRE